ncbi:MAG: hypothetical protein FJ041_07900, partial [Candidatus Cloacimonetes bacterium]|nr:hypothetical protein [Candidatus Cloacimonadota bacterium]
KDMILSNTGIEAELLDVVRLKARKVEPFKDNPHQVENWEYDNRVKWMKLKSITFSEIPQGCISKEELLFFNTKPILNKQDMSLIRNGFRSLQFIKPDFLEFYIKEFEGRFKIYSNLSWNRQIYKKLSLTDLHFVNIMEEMHKKFESKFFFITPNPLLLVSLSGIFELDLCYYKLIASIINGKDWKVRTKNNLFYSNLKQPIPNKVS